jgi:F0F1-type ATP synthase membrane subunit c/vacuolar-type H+-ATPase subunit K
MANLTPEQRKAARRKGLLAFGAQMLTATDPRGNRAQGLSALGQGVMAAQGGYGQGIEQGMATNQAEQEKAMWAQLGPQPGETLPQTYARLQRMLSAAGQVGNMKFAQMISGVLQTLPTLMGKESGGALKPSDMLKERDGYYYAPDPNAPGGFAKTRLRWDQGEGRVNLPVNWTTTQSADGSVIQVNPRTGETRPVMDAQGKPLMGPRRALTEAENKNAGFYDLAAAADSAMADPNMGAPQTPLGKVAGEVPLIGNMFISSANQERRQLGQQFINAILRRESGAAIPDSEYPKYERQYIPTYGDSPEVLARKARARAIAVAGLKRSGGRAFGPTTPDGVANEFADVEAAFQ